MKTTFTNEYRKPTSASVSVKDIIQHVKEAEAKVEQLEQRNKALLNELTAEKLARKKAELQAEENARLYEAFAKGNRYAKELLTVKDEKISKLESQLSNATEKVAKYKRLYQEEVAIGDELEQLLKKATSDIKLLTKLAKDLHARVQSWQRIAKNLFRKNRDLEIEAICKECEVDEAYDRIRELEEELAEHDMIIEEIITSAEEEKSDLSNALDEANHEINRLDLDLSDKDWRLKDLEEQAEHDKLREGATSVGSILAVAKEVADYEIDQVFIEAWTDRSVEYEITRQQLNDEIICGLGYIKTEATEIESLWRVERICQEIDDILNNFSSFAE